MKRPYRLTLFSLISFFLLLGVNTAVLAQQRLDKKTATAIVNKWNDAHTIGRSSEFKELYSEQVIYYGSNRTKKYCAAAKEKFLLRNPNYRQIITSGISLQEYASGLFKCNFEKKTSGKSGTHVYPAYLLVKYEDGGYRVAGESDTISDHDKGYDLDLGPERKDSTWIVVTIIIALIIAVLLFASQNKKGRASTTINSDPDFITTTEKQLPVVDKQVSAVITEAQHKGHKFESYVVDKFEKQYFKLIEWRSDKIHNGKYPASNMHPDLEFRFNLKSHSVNFAVECKWRSSFYNGQLEWAREHQIANYRNFRESRNIPVFIIIGVGNTPEAPERVYIIPLEEIKSTTLQESQIRRYKRYKTGNFYFNPVTGILD